MPFVSRTRVIGQNDKNHVIDIFVNFYIILYYIMFSMLYSLIILPSTTTTHQSCPNSKEKKNYITYIFKILLIFSKKYYFVI